MEVNFLPKHQRIVLTSVTVLLLSFFIIFFGIISHPDFVSAAAVSWTGLGDGTTWEDAANWSSDPAVPGAADDVSIDGATVEINATTTINSLDIGSSSAATLVFDYDALTSGALILDDGSLSLASGSTITHTEGTNVVTATIYLDIQTGTTDIDGTIDVNERGFTQEDGPGAGQDGQAGAGHGGQGGRDIDVIGVGGPVNGSLSAPITYGSGGGDPTSSDGGGAIRINSAGNFTIDGVISANGGDAGNVSGTGFGGGSGGSIFLITSATLSGSGEVVADGGDGGSQLNPGGGGGGGRISLTYLVDSSSFVELHAAGGVAGSSNGDIQGGDGGSGTIYLFDSDDDTNGHVVIDNDDNDPTFIDLRDGRTPLGTLTLDSLTVQNFGTLENQSGETLTVSSFTWSNEAVVTDSGGVFAPLSGGGALTVPSSSFLFANTTRTYTSLTVDGTLTHSNNFSAQTYAVDLNTSGSFTVSGTGSVDVNHRGYDVTYGPGSPTSDSSGAGHGGGGGTASDVLVGGGPSYGSITAPTLLGSGGDLGVNARGGGAIEIDAASVSINGSMSADGRAGIFTSGNGHGGGSGGSIYIKSTGSFGGTGSIVADGGNGGNQLTRAGAGSGGRIAVTYLSDSSSLSALHAAGGESPNSDEAGDGASGTVYLFDTDDDTNGHLIIDNDDFDTTAQDFRDGLISVGSTSYDSCILRNFGILEIDSGDTVVCSTFDWSNEGVLYDNGGIFTLLSSGGSLTVPSTATLFANTNGRSYTDVSVDGILTHSNNNDTQIFEIDISTSGALTVSGTGSINLNYRGYFPGEGTGAPAGVNGGGAHGGDGGDGSNQTTGGDAYGSLKAPVTIGSAASDGGARGGGAIEMTATSIDIDGSVSADGRDGSGVAANGRGGGAGGSIYLTTPGALTGSGSVSSTGGNGVNQLTSGGGGSGGRVAMYYLSDSSTITYDTSGGVGGAGAGGAGVGGSGTLFIMDTNDDTDGHLTINNGDITDYETDLEAGRTPVTTTTFDSITIEDFGNLELNFGETITYGSFDWTNEGVITDFGGTLALISGGGDLTIPSTAILFANTSRTYTNITVNGTLTHSNNNASQTNVIDLTTTGSGDFTVSGTGSIDVTGRGYYGGNGPGAGIDAGNWGTGAGHGGSGGTTNGGGAGGSIYGVETIPQTLGSSGGNDGSNEGGSGGGAIELTVGGDLTMNGSIIADAADDALTDGGGGSGGSVYLVVTDAVIGAATISADGGDAQEVNGGAGGGGRVRIECADGTGWTPNVTTVAGTVGFAAGDGTFSDACSASVPSPPGGNNNQHVSNFTFDVLDANACTPDGTVTLQLQASNATHVIISEDPNFGDAQWEVFLPNTGLDEIVYGEDGKKIFTYQKNWSVSEMDGLKEIFVRFRSSAQNVTFTLSDNVILDKASECSLPPNINEVPEEELSEGFGNGCDGSIVELITLEELARFRSGINPTLGEFATVDNVKVGSYIRSESESTVYCVTKMFELKPFLDEVTYFTYQRTFEGEVVWVTDETIIQMMKGEPMLPKPEVTLVKFMSGPEVYLSESDLIDPAVGILQWIENEETAEMIAGRNWADFVIDLNPELKSQFQFGEPLNLSDDTFVNKLDLRKRLLLNEKNRDQTNDSQIVITIIRRLWQTVFNRGL